MLEDDKAKPADQQIAYASSQLSGLYMFDVTADAAPLRYVDGIWAGEGQNARGRATRTRACASGEESPTSQHVGTFKCRM